MTAKHPYKSVFSDLFGQQYSWFFDDKKLIVIYQGSIFEFWDESVQGASKCENRWERRQSASRVWMWITFLAVNGYSSFTQADTANYVS